jgi:hypothetical protein
MPKPNLLPDLMAKIIPDGYGTLGTGALSLAWGLYAVYQGNADEGLPYIMLGLGAIFGRRAIQRTTDAATGAQEAAQAAPLVVKDAVREAVKDAVGDALTRVLKDKLHKREAEAEADATKHD